MLSEQMQANKHLSIDLKIIRTKLIYYNDKQSVYGKRMVYHKKKYNFENKLLPAFCVLLKIYFEHKT